MTALARRAAENPILTPAMVRPSRPELEVVGVFNPAITRHANAVVALLRVAEGQRPVAGEVTATIYDARGGRLEVLRWGGHGAAGDLTDPRRILRQGPTCRRS